MKKHTKVLAVLSTTAFMAAFAPNFLSNAPVSSVYAASAGWTQENGGWVFYDSDGDLLTDTWKKRGDDWFYLDSEGMQAINAQVDEYYVGEDGKRVTESWISVENEDYGNDESEPEYYWYYYGKNGKMTTSRWMTIEGSTYYFNEDGHMMTGEISLDGFNYYLGEEGDGKMKTGWIQLEDENEDSDYTESWFYYDRSGKRVENQVDKKIDGAYYTFEDGRMQTGWYKLPVTETASASEAAPANNSVAGYQYYDEDGKRASDWRTIEGVEGISEEGETYRFYFKNGKPYYAESGLELFSIDSKKYAFNTKGEMQTGKQVVNTGDGEVANFYFGEDGVMRTGKQVIYDEKTDENQNWYFHTDGSRKGQGYHGIKDNVLYIYGLRQEADKDLRYVPVELNGNQYLVNANGVVQKASSSSKSSTKPELGNGFKDYKDENDKIWVVSTEGVIQQ